MLNLIKNITLSSKLFFYIFIYFKCENLCIFLYDIGRAYI
jgi:hypothetical protein